MSISNWRITQFRLRRVAISRWVADRAHTYTHSTTKLRQCNTEAASKRRAIFSYIFPSRWNRCDARGRHIRCENEWNKSIINFHNEVFMSPKGFLHFDESSELHGSENKDDECYRHEFFFRSLSPQIWNGFHFISLFFFAFSCSREKIEYKLLLH